MFTILEQRRRQAQGFTLMKEIKAGKASLLPPGIQLEEFQLRGLGFRRIKNGRRLTG
jgi:hypothetical protein